MKPSANSAVETLDAELHELFCDELADIYDAEQQLIKVLPQLAKCAGSDLRDVLQIHFEETKLQITRLKQVFAAVGAKPRTKTCQGMKGLLAESGEVMLERADSAVLDAALIVVTRKVEHYEIVSYQALVAWAEQLEQDDAITLLNQNLEEEKETEGKLRVLAISLAQEQSSPGNS